MFPAGAVLPVASGSGGYPAADGKAPDSGRRSAPSRWQGEKRMKNEK